MNCVSCISFGRIRSLRLSIVHVDSGGFVSVGVIVWGEAETVVSGILLGGLFGWDAGGDAQAIVGRMDMHQTDTYTYTCRHCYQFGQLSCSTS